MNHAGWPDADGRVTLADRSEVESAATMAVWPSRDPALEDTIPPAEDVGPTSALVRMVPKVARRADIISDAIASLYSRGAEVERAFDAGSFAGAERKRLAKARLFACRSLREFGAVVFILLDEMKARGQTTELAALGDLHHRVEQDVARFSCGLADRDGRGGRSGGPPMLRISDDYRALASTLRAYAVELESGLETT